MNPTRIITAAPSAFVSIINDHIAATDAALRVQSISMHTGLLTAVVEQLPAGRFAPGSLIEVRANGEPWPADDAAGLVAEIVGCGPNWSILAAFAAKPAGKVPGGLFVVAAHLQPV
jgi:CHASE1-domain containing sensor protein